MQEQCSNCYGGCTTVTSDKCVKYTGVDIPILGIQSGDSLSYITQALSTFLVSTLDGTGIKPDINPEIICDLVSNYLPTCGDISIVDISSAIIKALCALQTEVQNNSDDIVIINNTLAELNANYTTNCLSGMVGNEGTHAILQATLQRLCVLINSLPSTYVQSSELCSLVEACLSSGGANDKAYNKMIPYTIIEYYGNLSNYPAVGDSFDSTGAGQNYWEKVYICNGNNGTPDKRGRVQVGAIDGIPGSTPSDAVNPAFSYNPNYSKGVPFNGSNRTFISELNLPAHTHTATSVSTVVEPNDGLGHNHASGIGTSNNPGTEGVDAGGEDSCISHEYHSTPIFSADDWTSKSVTGITVNTVTTNASTGGNQAISVVQPGIGCVYIMYIP
jgi:hypothetical protein